MPGFCINAMASMSPQGTVGPSDSPSSIELPPDMTNNQWCQVQSPPARMVWGIRQQVQRSGDGIKVAFGAGDKQSDSSGPAELSKRIDPHMIIENGLSSSSNMSTGSKLYRYRLQSSSEISKGTP